MQAQAHAEHEAADPATQIALRDELKNIAKVLLDTEVNAHGLVRSGAIAKGLGISTNLLNGWRVGEMFGFHKLASVRIGGNIYYRHSEALEFVYGILNQRT